MERYYHGLHASNNVMEKYVDFIISQLPPDVGASVSKTTGFPMKGYNVPVKLEVIGKTVRTVVLRITTLGFTKEFEYMMSRHKSPDVLLHEIQFKINDHTNQIILENKLDPNKIWTEYILPKGEKFTLTKI